MKELYSDDIQKCLQNRLSTDHATPMSKHDVLLIKKMKESTNTLDGLYTMPLPFKDTPYLLDNTNYALKHFKSL